MVKKNPIVLFHTEEFNFEKVKNEEGKGETIIISGNAQPLNEDSRNGVRYRPESVKKAHNTLKNAAFLFNHDTNRSLGHVVEVGLNDTHMTYRADVDPEEKEYIRKAERGDIRHVSVGCMVENIKFNEEENMYECDVKEYVELSAVPVPGFSNTSATKEQAVFLANALGDEEVLEKLKTEEVDKDKDDEEEADDKDDEEDEKCEPKDKKKGESDTDDEDDKEEADDEDDKDKDVDDEEESTDSDDEKDDEEKDGEDDEEEPEKDSEEKLEGAEDETETEEFKTETPEKKEEAEEEETAEEKLAKTIARVEELFSKFDEFNNRLSIMEANIDALNDTEEATEDLELSPSKEEKFKDDKHVERTKEEFDAKEKVLSGSNSKKINEDKQVIDMDKVRLKNVSY